MQIRVTIALILGATAVLHAAPVSGMTRSAAFDANGNVVELRARVGAEAPVDSVMKLFDQPITTPSIETLTDTQKLPLDKSLDLSLGRTPSGSDAATAVKDGPPATSTIRLFGKDISPVVHSEHSKPQAPSSRLQNLHSPVSAAIDANPTHASASASHASPSSSVRAASPDNDVFVTVEELDALNDLMIQRGKASNKRASGWETGDQIASLAAYQGGRNRRGESEQATKISRTDDGVTSIASIPALRTQPIGASTSGSANKMTASSEHLDKPASSSTSHARPLSSPRQTSADKATTSYENNVHNLGTPEARASWAAHKGWDPVQKPLAAHARFERLYKYDMRRKLAKKLRSENAAREGEGSPWHNVLTREGLASYVADRNAAATVDAREKAATGSALHPQSSQRLHKPDALQSTQATTSPRRSIKPPISSDTLLKLEADNLRKLEKRAHHKRVRGLKRNREDPAYRTEWRREYERVSPVRQSETTWRRNQWRSTKEEASLPAPSMTRKRRASSPSPLASDPATAAASTSHAPTGGNVTPIDDLPPTKQARFSS